MVMVAAAAVARGVAVVVAEGAVVTVMVVAIVTVKMVAAVMRSPAVAACRRCTRSYYPCFYCFRCCSSAVYYHALPFT